MLFTDIGIVKFHKICLQQSRFSSKTEILGSVHVTSSHVIFTSESRRKEMWVSTGLISTIDKEGETGSRYKITIKTKHFLTMVFFANKEKECQELYDALVRASIITNISEVFAFRNKKPEINEKVNNIDNIINWKRLDWKQEFRRQKVSSQWKRSNFNHDFEKCDTYPCDLWFPSKVSMQILIGSSKYRARSRLPILTYFNSENNASICICAKFVQDYSASCIEDDDLIKAICETNIIKKQLYIIDIQNYIVNNINNNIDKNEDEIIIEMDDNFKEIIIKKEEPEIKTHYFDISNIHCIRNSYIKLIQATQCNGSQSEYLSLLDESEWHKHIKSVLDCSIFIFESIKNGISCLVQCTDGWDRAIQTTSLAELMLDPYYRTLKGFQILVEKDWLGFGHKFSDRCGHVTSVNQEMKMEVSPIFTLFLDCVHQIMKQNPRAFEFNERWLIEINEYVYSCEFGTFIGNCEKDRSDLKVVETTPSVWNYFDEHIDDYKNPFYDNSISVITNLSTHPSDLDVWSFLYNRYDSGILPRESIEELVSSFNNHINAAKLLIKPSKYQSIFNVISCSEPSCFQEFNCVLDKRNNCNYCGLIYCKKCLKTKNSINICLSCSRKFSQIHQLQIDIEKLDPNFSKHYNTWDKNHIEVPERLSSILNSLNNSRVTNHLTILEPVDGKLEDIYLNHPKEYVDEFKDVCSKSDGEMIKYCENHEDIYVNKDSYTCALRSVGCCVKLMETLLLNRGSTGFAGVRPPGHHAYKDYPNGFCFFNNAAICAKKALKLGIKKVLIIDWDVHAGQGTQFSIEGIDGISLISIHRYENGCFWPNLEESGLGSLKSSKNTINIPLNQIGLGDFEYLTVFNKIILPYICDYKPELIIVSCGFDAAIGDPEGKMKISPYGYGLLTRLLASTGINLCMILEGGYFIESVKESCLKVIESLVEKKVFSYISKESLEKNDKNFMYYLYGIMKNISFNNNIITDILLLLEKYHNINGTKITFDIKTNDYKGIRNVPKPYATTNLYDPYDYETEQKFLNELKNSLIIGEFKCIGDEIFVDFKINCICFTDKLKIEHVININSKQEAAFIIYCLILVNIWRWNIPCNMIDFTYWIQSFPEKREICDNDSFLKSLHTFSLKYNLEIF
ncbi:BcDNA.GH04637 [Strongyloides ratti]|uniref:BcDNA.GH04637 n=1 Tax=Strongyloides ratti TaxID=34506 RepID=A0A090LEA5_STRRB|nr:BcDNA.GH04637 [Strongyloides ratti]CEF66478.1 BcDNA.GH04637 [Strongyloides ratti]